MRDFIYAASGGNLDSLKKKLAEDPNIKYKLNQTEEINPYNLTCDYRETHSALSVAWRNDEWETVSWLLEQGANPNANPGHRFGSGDNIYGSILEHFDHGKVGVNINLFISILRKTTHLNPMIKDEFDFRNKSKYSLATCIASHSTPEKMSAYLLEAVIRSETNVIFELLEKNKYQISFSDTILEDLLKNREIAMNKKADIYAALDLLVKAVIITENESLFLKQKINEHLQVSIQSFPEALQDNLTDAPSCTLHEMYAELQHWLYPDELLPVCTVNSPSFMQNNYTKTKEEIAAWQNPIHLYDFLKLKPLDALQFLHTSDMDNDPAVLLLAQILLYKSNDLIEQTNGEMKPFLTKEQQIIGVSLVNKYFDNLTTAIVNSRRQSAVIDDLRQQNKDLIEQVETMSVQVKTISVDVEKMTKQLDETMLLLKQILKNQQPVLGNKEEKNLNFSMFKAVR